MSDIYYFAVGFTHNQYIGVDGGHCIRNPLFMELMNRGHQIHWLGMNYLKQFDNPFLEYFGIKRELNTFDISQLLDTSHNIDNINSDSILIAEMRPGFDKSGYNFLTEWNTEFNYVKKFLDVGAKVFIWDQDAWSEYIPQGMREQIILLKAYKKKMPGFNQQHEWVWSWSDCFSFQTFDKKIFDFAYCGNESQRRDDFLKFMKPLEGNKKVLVTGNWLREQTRDFALDNFPHFMWIGPSEMWSTIPLLRLAKATPHFSSQYQQEHGMPCIRIFEAFMAGIPCFTNREIVGIEDYVPKGLLIKDGEDLKNKYENSDLETLFEKFAEKMKDKNVKNQVNEFEKFIK